MLVVSERKASAGLMWGFGMPKMCPSTGSPNLYCALRSSKLVVSRWSMQLICGSWSSLKIVKHQRIYRTSNGRVILDFLSKGPLLNDDFKVPLEVL